jgi:hypothetical protein
MSNIQQYAPTFDCLQRPALTPDINGAAVLYADHVVEIAKLVKALRG